MKRLIFAILIILIFPGVVLADNISLNCPSEVELNAEYTCSLTGYTDSGISSLSARVVVGGNTTFVGFITNRDLWQGDGAGGDVQLYREDETNGTFNIGTIKLKSINNSDNVVTIEEVMFYDSSGKELSINPISRIVKIKKEDVPTTTTTTKKADSSSTKTTERSSAGSSSNKSSSDTSTTAANLYLVDLSVEGYELDFFIDTLEYNLRIEDEDSLVIVPVVEDDSIKYSIVGNEKLVNGSVIKIILSDDKNTKEYKINIIKEAKTTSKTNYKLIFIIVIGVLVVINVLRILISKGKGGDE